MHTIDHGCSSASGLRLWLEVLCHVCEGEAIWCGTQCSSFLLLCLSKSNRREHNGYVADTNREIVRDGNRQMVVANWVVGWGRDLGAADAVRAAAHAAGKGCPGLSRGGANLDVVGAVW